MLPSPETPDCEIPEVPDELEPPVLLSLPGDIGDEFESLEWCEESPESQFSGPGEGVAGLSVVEVQVVLGACVVVVVL